MEAKSAALRTIASCLLAYFVFSIVVYSDSFADCEHHHEPRRGSLHPQDSWGGILRAIHLLRYDVFWFCWSHPSFACGSLRFGGFACIAKDFAASFSRCKGKVAINNRPKQNKQTLKTNIKPQYSNRRKTA